MRAARYVTHFGCLASACEAACCCCGGAVPVDESRHRRLTLLSEGDASASQLRNAGIQLLPLTDDARELRTTPYMLHPNLFDALRALVLRVTAMRFLILTRLSRRRAAAPPRRRTDDTATPDATLGEAAFAGPSRRRVRYSQISCHCFPL